VTTTPVLELAEVSAGYGSALALDSVSLTLPAFGSLALLGRNGAGKSTLLTTCLGLTEQYRGVVRLNGVSVNTWPVHRRAQQGLGWVPQERHVFRSLSVQEHLTAVARPGPWTAERVCELFPSLAARRKQRGLELSGGEQQMLALGRALVTNPEVLLLDEPLEGLAPVIVREVLRVLRLLSAERTVAFIIAEQQARVALNLTEQVMVLERGRSVYSGKSAALLADGAGLERLLHVGARVLQVPA
jgi:branched-chain amino acid transport system ATP-binding protein